MAEEETVALAESRQDGATAARELQFLGNISGHEWQTVPPALIPPKKEEYHVIEN